MVVDASVWVSAFMFPASAPDQAVELARRRRVQSLLSDPLIDQVQRAILGPRFGRSAVAVRVLVAEMRDVSQLVVPTIVLAVIAAKESANRILACAVAGGADLIVTGDRRHLLPLGAYEGIRIVSPAAFLRSLGR